MTYVSSCTDKPIAELEIARQALRNAIDEEAPAFSPLTYARAESELLAAEQELEAQYARWFWERNYVTAIEFLTWATADSHRAIEETVEIKKIHSN